MLNKGGPPIELPYLWVSARRRTLGSAESKDSVGQFLRTRDSGQDTKEDDRPMRGLPGATSYPRATRDYAWCAPPPVRIPAYVSYAIFCIIEAVMTRDSDSSIAIMVK